MFRRSAAKRETVADLVEAKEMARKAKLQLAIAKARRPRVDEEIRRQHEIREADGFAAIIEEIFVVREDK